MIYNNILALPVEGIITAIFLYTFYEIINTRTFQKCKQKIDCLLHHCQPSKHSIYIRSEKYVQTKTFNVFLCFLFNDKYTRNTKTTKSKRPRHSF